MSNVSIYEKSWTDLVFEDKNKQYGAYQLRQENTRTTLFALLSGITFITLLLLSFLLFSSFNSKPEIPNDIIPDVTIVPVTLEAKKEPLRPKAETKKSAAAAATENKFKRYEASKTPDDVDVPKNETPLVPEATGTDSGTGSAIDTPTEGGGGSPTGTVIAAPPVDNTTKTTNELDRLPEYPGGISKFYQYVSKNIDKPEVDEHLSSISVLMSFVIEKDGTMTDIKALRSTDKDLEREAIKVLKALKVKWSPGYKDNQKMRTLYVLPIKVAL